MSKGFIILGRKNGKMIGLLQRVLESAENYGKAEVVMEIGTKRAIDELAKRCRYSQKVLRGINESLTLGNSKWNQKN